MAKNTKINQNIIQPIDKTELIWPGKRKEVERVELPFQTIETINLPRGARQKDIFDSLRGQKKIIKDKGQLSAPQQDEWKNRLIWGDNLLIMGSLLKEFAGKINLIYIDPPFATGDDFSFKVQIGDQEITKEPSALEVKAYRDTWGKGMQSYLQMMYDRLVLMKELLADDGLIYVHLDWHVVHYLKAIMDEIFGNNNFRNEIVVRRVRKNIQERKLVPSLNVGLDTILFYAKSERALISPPRKAGDRAERWHNFEAAGYRNGMDYELFSFKPNPGNHWRWSLERAQQAIKEGTLRAHPKTGKPEYRLEASTSDLRDNLWDDILAYSFRWNYDTEKNEELLDLIINSSSKEGDLVADFFAGSGTTGAVAEKLGRRWIMADLGRFAIHTSRKRLLNMSAKPFVVQNLGRYERHRWVQLNGRYINYLKFILELYHAEPVEGFTNLHGKKDKAFVRVGAVDAPVTLSEIREALGECRKNKIKALDVLGWEWEMGLHDLVKEEAERYGVKLSTFQIPREVMELNVSDPKVKEDIHFYELAYLEVEPKTEGKRIIITLKDFIIPNPELLPEEVKDKVKNWSDFIDYWSVDWMFNQHEEQTEEDDTFHNMNQEYRTRKNPKLNLSMSYDKYPKAGKYNILVKVIDIFGNDTTKLLQIKV